MSTSKDIATIRRLEAQVAALGKLIDQILSDMSASEAVSSLYIERCKRTLETYLKI